MTANEGLALGYKRAEDAANNAGEAWRALAYAALLKFAEAYTTFSIEDVRRGNPQLPAPPDNRAWGSIARRAVREGAIEFLRYDKAKLPNVHGSTVRVWRSKLG